LAEKEDRHSYDYFTNRLSLFQILFLVLSDVALQHPYEEEQRADDFVKNIKEITLIDALLRIPSA